MGNEHMSKEEVIEYVFIYKFKLIPLNKIIMENAIV